MTRFWPCLAEPNVAAEIARLFDVEVVVKICDPTQSRAAPFPEENTSVVRAVERRRREFSAGRDCARRAIAELGGPVVALPSGPGRGPVWPPGFVGSITHCEAFCCAVVARAGRALSLGVDAEAATALEEGVAQLVCRDEERLALAGLPNVPGLAWDKIVFSAKESVYKCYFPVLNQFLDFQDVKIELTPSIDPRRGSFSAKLVDGLRNDEVPGAIKGRWWVAGLRVHTGAAMV